MDTTIDSNRKYLVSIVMVTMAVGLLIGYNIAVFIGAGQGLKAFFTGALDFVYTDQMHIFTALTALIGCIACYYLSPLVVSRFGYKSTLMLAALLLLLSALGCMSPELLLFEQGQPTYLLFIVFNIHRFIGGIGMGLALAVCMQQAPSCLNILAPWGLVAVVVGLLAAYVVCAIILGHHSNPVVESIGMGINRVLPESDPWTITTGWRYMFASEAVPAVLFMLLLVKR